MAKVEINGLSKRFGDATAVDGLDLVVEEGEFLTLLGPSGCGKTTTLRCVAGLETPAEGDIHIGGECVVSAKRQLFTPPERRRLGMVFQSYALWPHMTVFGNVAYPLRMQRRSRSEIAQRVMEVLALVRLEDYAQRSPSQLSGGQQQRVALARAMAADPRLLLFDEPLSNLDTKLRGRMRDLLLRLHRSIGTTSIYVTHDQLEALTLSDRIVVMNDGRIEQTGSPQEIYTSPASRFVADFVGFENIHTGVVCGGWSQGYEARVGDLTIKFRHQGGLGTGESVTLAVRGCHIGIATEPRADHGEFAVVNHVYLGDQVEYALEGNGLRLIVRKAAPDGTLDSHIGSRLWARIPPEHIVGLKSP
ncbi:ABC transporter ATP-binding protein [Rhizohabitans arisaemae]|uniref:ABC transporter ATP-binding protein n=1 Tax=Rhizohabitans arisaemae TaxID=2720610 RepID=UPI0024B0C6EA|nr:ABC transporter ATP-binding protein [Rhizohabitans arisaemae]